MPKAKTGKSTISRTMPYSVTPIDITMFDLQTLRANSYDDAEQRVCLKGLPIRTFFQITNYERSSVALQTWAKNGIIPYRVTLQDYFSNENIKPIFSCIIPERYCECVESSFGLVYFGMYKTSSGFDAHRIKFYKISDIVLLDESADIISRILTVNTCDGSCEGNDEEDTITFGYCGMCGNKLSGGQHSPRDCGEEITHCTVCGKVLA